MYGKQDITVYEDEEEEDDSGGAVVINDMNDESYDDNFREQVPGFFPLFTRKRRKDVEISQAAAMEVTTVTVVDVESLTSAGAWQWAMATNGKSRLPSNCYHETENMHRRCKPRCSVSRIRVTFRMYVMNKCKRRD